MLRRVAHRDFVAQALASGEKPAAVAPRQEIYQPAYKTGLRVLTGQELLKIDLPPRELLLAPWLPAKGLAMIHAERGIGKPGSR
jgi:hypothetical protein